MSLELALLLQKIFAYCGYPCIVRDDGGKLGWVSVTFYGGETLDNEQILDPEVLNILREEFVWKTEGME